MQAETAFKQRVLRDLKTLRPHLWVVKVQQMAIRGTPDLLLCVRGTFVAVELKRAAEVKPDPLQVKTLGDIDAAGGICYVAYPDNWPKIYADLRKLAG